ncbi:hypothetical protein PABG_07370 [Paracoccidioides brasiliensis Pb03]|nr:hypothetical protein PABG_07370 [Paracoccidioides brasiliensis Pb03]
MQKAPSHRHTITAPPRYSLTPSAANSSASGLPTSLTNQQNRGPGRGRQCEDGIPRLDTRIHGQHFKRSQCNYRYQPEAQRRRHFASTPLPRQLVAFSRVPRNLATSQGREGGLVGSTLPGQIDDVTQSGELDGAPNPNGRRQVRRGQWAGRRRHARPVREAARGRDRIRPRTHRPNVY